MSKAMIDTLLADHALRLSKGQITQLQHDAAVHTPPTTPYVAPLPSSVKPPIATSAKRRRDAVHNLGVTKKAFKGSTDEVKHKWGKVFTESKAKKLRGKKRSLRSVRRSVSAVTKSVAPSYTSNFTKLHECIMKDNGLTKEERIWKLGGGSQWMDSTNLMFVRESWTGIASILMGKRNAILRGKAGRGKSLFLLFFMFEILLCAKEGVASQLIRGLQPQYDVVIIYVDRSGAKYCVTVQDAKIISGPGLPANVSFYFSDDTDVTDANIGSVLTLAAASGDDAVLKEFSKRIDGIHVSALKANLCMSSPSLEEMAAIFPQLSAEELQFKFAVVGGHPRKFTADPMQIEKNQQFYDIVEEMLVWMFGEEYQPSDGGAPTLKQQLGRWAINLVVGTLINASVASKTDSSLFKEYIVRADHTVQREQFASRFLSSVAGRLHEQVETDLMTSLKHLFGASGIRYAFECTSHIVRGGANRY